MVKRGRNIYATKKFISLMGDVAREYNFDKQAEAINKIVGLARENHNKKKRFKI